MGAKGKKHKTHAGHSEDATVRNKQRFIEALAKGMQPYLAADHCHISPTTAFSWKANDPEFAAAWLDAIELALDKLEHDVYGSGIPSNAQFILKARRKSVYGPHLDEQRLANGANFLLQIAEQEHRQRLQRLGLAPPDNVIEGDYEEVDASVPAPSGGTSSDS